jgi:galactose mutarotase-like enzyme
MNYKLSSDKLSVTVNLKGAELSSVVRDDLEYIWQAKPDVWARHAPVLFPIVGRLKNNTFSHGPKNYTLSQHGFARDMEFTLLDHGPAELKFGLVSNEITKAVFPFEFDLVTTYTINSDVMTCSYEVKNPSFEDLFFSIGAHPGFAMPDGMQNYVLKFKTDKQYEITLLSEGLLSNTKEKFHIHAGEVNLNSSLFDKDALVFENSQIDDIELISTKSGRGVELICKDWPYFGIWGKKECNDFVCLEPWYGITDSVDAKGEISSKKGIIKVEPGKKFECSFTMRFF